MRGISPTDCLRYINRNLGAAMQVIELTEDEMMRIVFQESLPTFSKYFPWHYRLTINLNKNRVPGTRSKYFLNDPEIDKVELLGVNKIFLSTVSYTGHNLLSLTTNPMESQLLNDAVSASVTPITHQFFSPNILEIHPYISGIHEAIVEINAVHPTHMKTIPMGLREDFLKLCYLDVLVSLLPLRKRFESISSVYGDIRLFLDACETAVADRQSLLEKFQENILRDKDAKRIWMA